MAKEGEVIACHTLKVWNEKIKYAKESNKLIVIDFTASWCQRCRDITPVYVDMAKKFHNVFFFMIDVDKLQSVAMEFDVKRTPTFVFMKGSKTMERVIIDADKMLLKDKLIGYGGILSLES